MLRKKKGAAVLATPPGGRGKGLAKPGMRPHAGIAASRLAIRLDQASETDGFGGRRPRQQERQARTVLAALLERRIAKPTMATPAAIIAHAEGSGTADRVAFCGAKSLIDLFRSSGHRLKP